MMCESLFPVSCNSAERTDRGDLGERPSHGRAGRRKGSGKPADKVAVVGGVLPEERHGWPFSDRDAGSVAKAVADERANLLPFACGPLPEDGV